MFSDDEADQLISLPKIIDGDGSINLRNEQTRLILTCSDAPEYSFIVEITLNKKIDFKISLHYQEHNLFIGLLRIDYKGRHQNPEVANDFLPDRFKPYIAKRFEINESHVHCYVAGYKPLVWALPLSDYKFPVLYVNNTNDTVQAINSFAKKINITTSLTIQTSII